MSITASELIALVSVSGAKEASVQLLGVGSASDDAGTKLRNLTIGATVIAGAALVGVGVKAIQMAGDFQQSTNQLVTSAGLSRDSIGAVRQGILDLSVSTATSTDQLAKGMFNIQSALHLGAGGLQVLKAAAEGAKAENSDLAQTTDVLTTAMVNYHLAASQAVPAMDSLIVTVADGKMHMDDLTGSLKNVLPVSAAFHIQLSDVEGALATMANAGDRGTAAGTHLAMMFKMLSSPTGTAAKEMKAMGLDSIKLAETMRQSLPDALKMIQDAVSKHFAPGSVEYSRAIQAILGGSKSGLAGLELFGQGLNALRNNTNDAAAALRKGGKDVENWDVIQGNFNFKLDAAKNAVSALMIEIGTALLPVVSHLLDVITPAITTFSKWVTSGHAIADVMGFISQHAQTMVPLLAGAGAIIGGLLVAAFYSLAVAAGSAAVAVIAATWPFLLIGAAVAGLVAIFMHFYQTSAPFKAFIDNLVGGLKQAWSVIVANFMPAMQAVGAAIQTYVMPILSQIGAFIVSNFMPVWKQLVDLWNNQLVPLGKQLWAALQPLMPLFRDIAILIGGVLVADLGLLVGLITAIIKGLAGFLSGLVIVIQGIVQLFTGVIQVVAGIIRVIIDLVTLNFSDLGPALGEIWQGIINIFAGAWTIIAGLFLTAWFTISGIVVGFVQGIIGFFTGLYDDIVGHSIIPDMVNGIINWFMSLVARGIALITNLVTMILVAMVRLEVEVLQTISLMVSIFLSWLDHMTGGAVTRAQSVVSGITGVLGKLPGMALQWGMDMINSFIQGIKNAAAGVGNVVSGVVGTIAGLLHHSKPDYGPLANDDQWMPDMMNMFASGIESGVPKIQAALSKVTKPLAVNLKPSSSGFAGGNLQSSSLVAMTSSAGTPHVDVHVHIGTEDVTNLLGAKIVNHIRRKTGMRV